MLGLPRVIGKGRSELTTRGGLNLDSHRVSTVGAESNAANPIGGGISALAGVLVIQSPNMLQSFELCSLKAELTRQRLIEKGTRRKSSVGPTKRRAVVPIGRSPGRNSCRGGAPSR
ncbi:hypothetical protein U1Q18_012254 [Sarracenia purpurea var. burkii]